jgi:hypothetical protein
MQTAVTSHYANFDDYGYGTNDNPYTRYSAEGHGTYRQESCGYRAEVLYIISIVDAFPVPKVLQDSIGECVGCGFD